MENKQTSNKNIEDIANKIIGISPIIYDDFSISVYKQNFTSPKKMVVDLKTLIEQAEVSKIIQSQYFDDNSEIDNQSDKVCYITNDIA